MNAIGTLVFILLVPGTVAIFIPYLLLGSHYHLLTLEMGNVRFLGLVPLIAGTLISQWCAWDFTFSGRGTPAPIAPPKVLVVKGLYQYVRNPMYVGVLLVLFGEALLFESVVLFLYSALLFSVFHTFVVLYEEPILRGKFADSYAKYCASVSRWIPKFKQGS